MSLFARLTAGYLVIFLMVAAVSSYAILMLRHFGELTESILKVDNRILDHERVLADLLLGQSRAEQKFVITRDEAWYLQFVRLKNDFIERIENAVALDQADARPILEVIQTQYRRYAELVDDEAGYVRRNRAYPQARYQQDKNALVDAMLSLFEQLRASQQQTIYSKVANLGTVADRAQQAAGTIAVVCLLAIMILSLLLTKSITRPIGLLKNKTQEIAAGNFDARVEVRSPPEIGELAEALNSMGQKLRELDRMKADFFAAMSHELRTPLTSIKEGTGLLLEGIGGPTTEKQRKLLAILAEESNRLILLVNSLLDLSKMEAGMMSYDFAPAQIDPLLKRAVAEVAPLVEAKQITIESAVDQPLPAVRIDAERILQVLRNLLGNAIKFTPKGGLVRVSARPTGNKLEVAVKDSGPGIPQEALLSIFEKFNQGMRADDLARSGTGLGLAIAKSIISSHGGKIWAESQLGHGSTFIFVLPC
ncbi:MAG TPA: HAMP domain-containing sensor histidine kinase [Candidatus Binatia bacterium]|nr:HAMP domain-containing sensor histidine kinase [Candidatus Binatia bacterium]